MQKLLTFLGQRRKAVAALLGLAAELITEAIPQANEHNAMVLHAVLAVLTVYTVHATPNDAKISVGDFVDDVVHGDDYQPAHAAEQPVESLAG